MPTFGVTSINQTSATYGIFQQLQTSEAAEVAEGQQEDGKRIVMKAFSTSKESQVQFLTTGTAAPAIGSTAVINSHTGLVVNRQLTEVNTNYQTGQLTTQSKDAAVLASY